MMDEKTRKEIQARMQAEFEKETIEELLGMNDPEVFIDHVCVECGFIDLVPEFIVAECAWGDEDGEEPTFFCPECNGTLVRKDKPKAEEVGS